MQAPIDLYKPHPLFKVKLTASEPFVPQYVQSIVSKSANPAEIYASRVHGRMLVLDNVVKESRLTKERKEKEAHARTAKAHKKLGRSGKIRGTARERGPRGFDESQAKFALFLPLHQLWLGYMSELLALPQIGSGPPRAPNGASAHPKLLKADLHGSFVTVQQSKNTSLLGLSGIVIHETEGTFKVVTKEDKLKTLPKRNSIFTLALPVFSTLSASYDPNGPLPIFAPNENMKTVLDGPHADMQLHGNQFCYRSAERAGKKFKPKETIEL